MATRSDEVWVDMTKLVQSVRRKTEMLEQVSSECCIYTVSPRLLELNKQAFTPKVVSIGPYHHGKNELRAMEDHKRRYLVDFLQRCGISLEEYVESIRKLEIPLRNSYAEMTQHTKEEFMEIMVVDGAFLLEYFLKFSLMDWSRNDRMFDRQRLTNDVRFDILMIENQLPFFLLESLFELFEKSTSADVGLSLKEVVAKGIMNSNIGIRLSIDNIPNGDDGEVNHLVDFLGIWLQPESDVEMKCESLTTPTISELHRAGVKFKPSSSNCLYDLKFEKGILEIPKLELRDASDIIFRNLQAFEQCHHHCNYMNDYTSIMNLLIDNEKDVEILVKNGIIENWLQDNHAAATMINELSKGGFVSSDDFYFAGLIEDLNAYYKTPWHKHKATLKQKYFNNPWAIISVVAAAILLLLTIIQTVCSTLQVGGTGGGQL